MEHKSLGERIKYHRKRLGLTQEQLAERMRVSAQAVSKWENDQTAPDTIKLIQLADVLDTDVEYLATGRRSYARRPPIVIRTTETVEKIVEKPVVETVEKVVERIVEKPIVKFVEKPVIRKIYRTKYVRNIWEISLIAAGSFIAGLLVGLLF